MQTDIWTYELPLEDTTDLEGFSVQAVDGSIGKVDEATYEVGAAQIVVDTGPWIFGRKVVIPAGAVQRVDLDANEIWLRLTKDQIKDSPEFDEDAFSSGTYRDRLSSYYGPFN